MTEETLVAKEYSLSDKAESFRKKLLNSFILKSFLLVKLPLALFAGLRIRELDANKCSVSLPYGWRSQNPFRSIYFAAQSMAAEMSTGAIALMALENTTEKVSMLVVGMHADFTKKADKITTFTCHEGHKIFDAVEQAIETGEGVPVEVETIGRMKDGTEVARFRFTWSFRKK